ncbi:hypothetical protein ACFO1B_30885 [Dactylosporangium siamense]|uniref:Uncharacterized protein n=1 Tax=Dactylosporangium siamense TaxID=685454 RepID=A0A919UAK2_9ACTN|nr:hypothetical protein [Dactylosporangium siamense]GIG48117.1 hypothetical protein Dsi01nite_061580 [Dactylosporangium siamense]
MAHAAVNIPEPDFTDSRELRVYCNEVRKTCHHFAMALHIGAAEMEAALSTIQPAEGVFKRYAAKRRARRVARHMRHAAACVATGGTAAVRTWAAFRAEYAPELSPVRGKRSAFKVVTE